MKLSRALLERREITKKIARIKEEIQADLVTQDHEVVKANVFIFKFKQLDTDMEALRQLNLKIDQANAQHLVEQLNNLRILDSKIDFYKTCRKHLITGGDDRRFYGIKEVKTVKNVSVDQINSALEKLENERKDLDSQIQEINWTIEI